MKGAASLKAEDYCEVSHAASTDPLQTRWRFAPGATVSSQVIWLLQAFAPGGKPFFAGRLTSGSLCPHLISAPGATLPKGSGTVW
jgi:hypothetical protein